MYEFILMIKYSLLQSLGFFILAIAAIALLFIILYTVSKSSTWRKNRHSHPHSGCGNFFVVFFASNLS